MTRLRKEWESHPDRHKDKHGYSEAAGAFSVAYQREAAEGGSREMQEFVQKAGVGERPDEVVYLLKDQLVLEFLHNGDRGRLVDLLSSVPANESTYGSIEQSLTSKAEWNRLANDGLAVLFDAYDRAVDAEAKESACLSVWCALGDAPAQIANRDEYMRTTREWYASNRGHLERSAHYDHGDVIMWKQGQLSGERPPHLFVLRSSDGR